MENYLSKKLLGVKAMAEESANSNEFKSVVSSSGIILFGAGFNGMVALDYFEENGYNVVAFCDNDTFKHGTIIKSSMGKELTCISPGELCKLSNIIVFITAKHFIHEVAEQLNKMNVINISFDEFVITKNIGSILKIYSDLRDDFSKKTLLYLIEAVFLKSDKFISEVWVKEQYFCLPEFSNFNSNDIFVDCGAFVGDTIEQFINSHNGIFNKIYAFEPGEKQFNALCIRKKRLVSEWALNDDQIECIFAGVSDINSIGKVSFSENNLIGTCLVESNDDVVSNVNIFTLDTTLKNCKVTILKADIEGYEMKMIKGAENLIKAHKPKLAISIYHKPQDFFEIALYIKNLVPEYKVAIRHHATQLMDTVLYCWI